MNPTTFYRDLPLEFLGVFYYYVFEKFEEYISPDDYLIEIRIMESVALDRGVSPSDLYEIGRDISLSARIGMVD
ncbi:hypothetical protein [Radiobacillus deserti]|uniref:Sporulation histidine kinase inhibitor Sda n=1 Tax=Radiobacillus deserti TaxID=2594883 RepID=A0A516KFU2_9BACI|nr:hypothetical protein [Radiobacillus deserti]QDP40261.1 hypothetical protein FN924_08790 [Radiobacillus deserti]